MDPTDFLVDPVPDLADFSEEELEEELSRRKIARLFPPSNETEEKFWERWRSNLSCPECGALMQCGQIIEVPKESRAHAYMRCTNDSYVGTYTMETGDQIRRVFGRLGIAEKVA